MLIIRKTEEKLRKLINNYVEAEGEGLDAECVLIADEIVDILVNEME